MQDKERRDMHFIKNLKRNSLFIFTFIAGFITGGIATYILNLNNHSDKDLFKYDSITYFKKAQYFDNENEFEKALENYAKAIAVDPSYTPAYLARGKLYCKHNRFDKALSDFNKVISLNPNHALAYLEKGNVFVKTRKLDEALDSYRNAAKCDPELLISYLNQSVIFFHLGKFDKGIEIATKGIEITKEKDMSGTSKIDLTRLYCQRGALFAQKKQYDKALEDYKKSIEVEAHNPVSYFNRALIMEKIKNDKKEALASYEKCLDLLNDKAKIEKYMAASQSDASVLFPTIKRASEKQIIKLKQELQIK